MDSLSLIVHLANFLAPAVFISVWMWVLGKVLWRHQSMLFKPWQQFVLNSVAGALVLLVGLVWGGQDGKMLTYTLLVVVIASLQWVFIKAWRG
jgi:hypothetical protein